MIIYNEMKLEVENMMKRNCVPTSPIELSKQTTTAILWAIAKQLERIEKKVDRNRGTVGMFESLGG